MFTRNQINRLIIVNNEAHPNFILIMLNYLEKYAVQKGYSPREIYQTKSNSESLDSIIDRKRDYPSRFTSYEEYLDALHEYLNGM